MEPITSSEDLAQRLRSLYKTYECENELPAHDDLVARLDSVEVEVREATKIELDRGYVYPISIKEAKGEARMPLSERIKTLYAFTFIGAVSYAEQKCVEKDQPCEGSFFFSRVVYGSLRAFPSALGEALRNLDPKEVMESHNYGAKKYFDIAKRNVKHYILD